MKRAWLIVLAAVLPLSAQAQNQPLRTGIVNRDFFVTDSHCKYEHDRRVEKDLQLVRVATDSAKPTRDTLTLRNKSVKTITAYVFNYTIGHEGRTNYYSGRGADLLYEIAIYKNSQPVAPNFTFPPGGVVEQDIERGTEHGKVEMYPCMVAFDDGTFIGPPLLAKFLMQMRSDSAKALGALAADLRSAQNSTAPKVFLTNRAQQLKRAHKGRLGEEAYAFLEIVASGLSSNGDTPLDRKAIADYALSLQAQQEVLVQQSALRATE